MNTRRSRIALVVAAAAITGPALLSALDSSAALTGAASPIGREPPSIDGMRRRAAASLVERRYAAASADARTVLARQPLDQPALRILSMAEAARDDADLAGEVAIDASFVSWRDPYVQLRLFTLTSASGELDDAAQRADALGRIDGFREEGFAALNTLLATPEGTRGVAARLATRPPWRDAYFRDVRRGLALAPQQALALLRALDHTAARPSTAEVDTVLAFMVARGLADQAWEFWRVKNGAGAPIDDPDLQSARIDEPDQVSSPFRWSMPADTPVRVVDRRDEAGQPALRIEHRGDRSVLFVSRRVVAAAGRYRLSYQAEGSAEDLDRLHPDLRCANGEAIPLRAVGAPGGINRSASDVVVSSGCGVLRLGFTLEPSDSAVPAELSIRRVAFTKV